MWRALLITLVVVLAAALVAHTVLAKSPPMRHTPTHGGQMPMSPGAIHEMHMRQAGVPHMRGQDAFGAIAEVVQILDADPKTDWSKVNLERLRQHLIDMNEVVLRAQVT